MLFCEMQAGKRFEDYNFVSIVAAAMKNTGHKIIFRSRLFYLSHTRHSDVKKVAI